MWCKDCLHLVVVLSQIWQTFLKTLTLACVLYDLVWFWCWFAGISWEDLPMIKHALWESLSTGVGAQVSCEAKRFVDRQESFDDEHWCSHNLRFFEDVATTTIEHTVNTSDSNFWTLNFAQVNRLHKTRRCCDERCIQDTTRCWNDLTASTMDSISV